MAVLTSGFRPAHLVLGVLLLSAGLCIGLGVGFPLGLSQAAPVAASATPPYPTLPNGSTGATSVISVNPGKSLTPQQLQLLTQWEQQWLTLTFEAQPPEQRLARLETAVFGKANPTQSTLLLRFSKLKGVVRQLEGVDASTTAQANEAAQSAAAGTYQGSPLTPVEAEKVAFLEQKFFATTYPKEGANPRLSRLETKIFGQSAPAATENAERVERLQVVLAGDPAAGRRQPVGGVGGGRMGIWLPILLTTLLILL